MSTDSSLSSASKSSRATIICCSGSFTPCSRDLGTFLQGNSAHSGLECHLACGPLCWLRSMRTRTDLPACRWYSSIASTTNTGRYSHCDGGLIASGYACDSFYVPTTKLVRCADKTKAMLVSARQTILDPGPEPYKDPLRYCDGPFLAHLVPRSDWRMTTSPSRPRARMACHAPSIRAFFLATTSTCDN